MANGRKQAQQKPPPGFIWIEDYRSEDGTEVILGIASRLGLTPSTYRKWRMAGKGPEAFRLGKRIAARIDVVNAWLDELETTARAVTAEAMRLTPAA